MEGGGCISKGDGILKGDKVFYFYSVFCQQITVTGMSAFLYLHQNNQTHIVIEVLQNASCEDSFVQGHTTVLHIE